MRVLFINANLYGHINPTLGLVKEMVSQGHEIDYICSEDFSDKVTEVGANWVGYPSGMAEFFANYQPSDHHPFFQIIEYVLLYDEMALPGILNVINGKDYDLLVSDSIFGTGNFLRKLTKLPVVTSHSYFAMSTAPVPPRMMVRGFHTQLDHCYDILARICEKYQIPEPTIEEVFLNIGDRNVVYTSECFNIDPKAVPPNYLFTGPSLNRKQEAADVLLPAQPDKKVIYISLGSINTKNIRFYQKCIEAFKDTEYQVYMSIGKKCELTELGDIPANFTVKKFMPQLELLKSTDLFITHAGFNSVNEALYYGVPMLLLPQVNDQHMVAKHVATLGLGKTAVIDELTADTLKEVALGILKDNEIKTKCLEMSVKMQRSGTVGDVVRELNSYVAALGGK